jgi:hypothetical protein
MPNKKTKNSALSLAIITLAASFFFGLLADPPIVSAQTLECQTACQTGLLKLAAEKDKNQLREAAKRQLQEAGLEAIRNCFSQIYGQSFSILGFPNLPNLSEALNQLCRSTQFTLSVKDFSLPQISLKDLTK